MSSPRTDNNECRHTPADIENFSSLVAGAKPNGAGKAKLRPEHSSGPEKAKGQENKQSQFKISQAQQQFLHSHAVAANFGNIVTVLMQSPQHKDCRLADLHNVVLPALKNNQFKLAQAHRKDSGYTVPIGVVLWARVSDTVDNKLSSTQTRDVKLSANEWASGDTIWIVEAVGEQRAVSSLINALRQKTFKGKTVKYRHISEDGIKVKSLAC